MVMLVRWVEADPWRLEPVIMMRRNHFRQNVQVKFGGGAEDCDLLIVVTQRAALLGRLEVFSLLILFSP